MLYISNLKAYGYNYETFSQSLLFNYINLMWILDVLAGWHSNLDRGSRLHTCKHSQYKEILTWDLRGKWELWKCWMLRKSSDYCNYCKCIKYLIVVNGSLSFRVFVFLLEDHLPHFYDLKLYKIFGDDNPSMYHRFLHLIYVKLMLSIDKLFMYKILSS